MTLLLTLLVAALQLKIALLSPNIPVSFRDSATQTVDYVITQAEAQINNPDTATTTPVITQTFPQVDLTPILPVEIPQQPIFGSVPMDKSDITIQVIDSSPASNDMPFGRKELYVSVFDKDGNLAKNVEVKMDAPNNLMKTIPEDLDQFTNLTGHANFNWIPSQQGTTTITFTSGNLVKTIDIVI